MHHRVVLRDSPSFEWSQAVEAVEWVLPRLDELRTGTVAVRVPHGYAAYARVFHPSNHDGGETWQSIAGRTGVEMHSGIVWSDLGRRRPGHGPDTMRTPWSVMSVLLEHL